MTDDGSRTLWNEDLNETYHSGCGAVSETLWVYLKNSGIPGRAHGDERSIRVFEFGFGTGTSFILTAAYAACHGLDLEYFAIEKNLLPASILAELELRPSVQALPLEFTKELEPYIALSDRFLEAVDSIQDSLTSTFQTMSPIANEWNELEYSSGHGISDAKCALQLYLGDACDNRWNEALVEPERQIGIDAIFFDAFSPETNPELWQSDVFRRAYDILKPGGTLTSYCVKSRVQKGLHSVGFSIEKLPGPPGGKREVLRAVK